MVANEAVRVKRAARLYIERWMFQAPDAPPQAKNFFTSMSNDNEFRRGECRLSTDDTGSCYIDPSDEVSRPTRSFSFKFAS